mmetsp:Transcript_32572/g.66390  ORF Transcript_32572/g.66390 Transcript_32572/m.66390 type:complete len:213 (-) Transcript_32572:389-1027(-)
MSLDLLLWLLVILRRHPTCRLLLLPQLTRLMDSMRKPLLLLLLLLLISLYRLLTHCSLKFWHTRILNIGSRGILRLWLLHSSNLSSGLFMLLNLLLLLLVTSLIHGTQQFFLLGSRSCIRIIGKATSPSSQRIWHGAGKPSPRSCCALSSCRHSGCTRCGRIISIISLHLPVLLLNCILRLLPSSIVCIGLGRRLALWRPLYYRRRCMCGPL